MDGVRVTEKIRKGITALPGTSYLHSTASVLQCEHYYFLYVIMQELFICCDFFHPIIFTSLSITTISHPQYHY